MFMRKSGKPEKALVALAKAHRHDSGFSKNRSG
jgi:hypothetical protein